MSSTLLNTNIILETADKELIARGCGSLGLLNDDECVDTKVGENEGNLCICDSSKCNTGQIFGLSISLGLITTSFLAMKVFS